MTLDFFHTFKKLSKLFSHCSLPLESMNKQNAHKNIFINCLFFIKDKKI
jgi:hypothetical protein